LLNLKSTIMRRKIVTLFIALTVLLSQNTGASRLMSYHVKPIIYSDIISNDNFLNLAEPLDIVNDFRSTDLLSLTSPIQAGGSPTFQFKVRYKGTSVTYLSVNSSLHLSSNMVWGDADDVNLRTFYSYNLTATDTIRTLSEAVTIPLNTVPGNYYILVKTDYDNQYTEPDETNNLTSLAITVAAPASNDFRATDLVSLTTPIQAGGSPTFQFKVRYKGTSVTYLSVNSSLHLSSNMVWGDADDVNLRTFYSYNLTATDTIRTLSDGVIIPANTVPGSYYILAKADYDNQYTEPDETNNVTSLAITVAAAAVNDFFVSDMILLTPVNQAGGKSEISFNHRYKGNSVATIYPYYQIRLSADQDWSEDDVSITNPTYVYNSSFSLNDTIETETHTGTHALSIPSATVPGNYYILVKSDPGNGFQESNEDNNVGVLPVTVEPVATKDFYITDLSAGPDTVQAGGRTRIDLIQRYTGNSVTLLNSYVSYILSSDEVYGNGDDVTLYPCGSEYSSLNVQTTSNAEYEYFMLPVNLIPGNYYIVTKADCSNAHLETDENNNITSKAIVVIEKLDDFYPANLVAPIVAEKGKSFRMDADQKYQGNSGYTNTVNMRYYLSENNQFGDGDDVYLASDVSGLNKSMNSEHEYAIVTLPTSVKTGYNHIFVKSDWDNQFSETDENNNVAMFRFRAAGTYRESDSLALVAFYNATNGPGWIKNTNWLTGPVNTWYGITLTNGRVTSIRIRENHLVGSLPEDICYLTELAELDISDNAVSGFIPDKIGLLSKLGVISLLNNQFSGEIPSGFWQITNLGFIDLSGNQFTGSIPAQIAGLVNLTNLHIGRNQFSGPLPLEITTLSKLILLVAPDNHFSGSLLPELGQMVNLTHLVLDRNQLTGLIPDELGLLTHLEVLHLSGNPLSGILPSTLGNLKYLYSLLLAENNLTGPIPPEYSNLSKLIWLNLSQNQLEGDVPTSIFSFPEIKNIHLQMNHFNSLPDFIKGPNLVIVNVENNNLSFEDLEYNMEHAITFNYSPQDSIGTSADTLVSERSAFSWELLTGGTSNKYQWYKDGSTVSGANTSTLTLPSVALADSGRYICHVTNTLVPGLVLLSRPLNLKVRPSEECPQHFHTAWEGTAGQDHMNLNIIEATLDGSSLQPGDEIGVFDGDICVGFGKIEQTIDFQHIFKIIVSRDDGTGNGFTSGNEISYILWDCSAEKEYPVQNAHCFDIHQNLVSCSPFETGGTAFVSLSATSQVCLNLSFNTGWNIFSSPNYPDSADMLKIFKPLTGRGSLVKIQDEYGNSVEDWGLFGGWVNSIGNIAPTEGYKIKVSTNETLEICGTLVKYPFRILLAQGWNIMGYPQTQSFSSMDVVQQLIDRKTLIKVQDETGNSIEDWGVFGGWQNGIGNFNPGEGYKIKVIAKDTLTIYESYTKSLAIPQMPLATIHFRKTGKGNGVDHMNINLVDIPSGLLDEGDEIGVFDGDICVGSRVIGNSEITNHKSPITNLSIPVSASDGPDCQGFTEGNPFTLKIWKAQTNKEYPVQPEIVKGSSTFVKHESSLASLRNLKIREFENLKMDGDMGVRIFPNPTTGKVYIQHSGSPLSGIHVSVVNATGQQVIKTVLETNPGYIDLSGCVSGFYYVRILGDSWSKIEKIVLR